MKGKKIRYMLTIIYMLNLVIFFTLGAVMDMIPDWIGMPMVLLNAMCLPMYLIR